MTTQIQADRLAIGYHGRAILTDISLEIAAGSFWGIVGPNGSGKTTLVKLLVGLYPPQGGRVLWGGHASTEVDLDPGRDADR